tara:strand:- start:825 stop:1235 length:411 start_codon:yes stop_codon:yes gene_type:complete
MEKFFYFRTVDVAGSDDDKVDSILIPINKITGIQRFNATTITIYYENPTRDIGELPFHSTNVIHSYVKVNIESGSVKKVMEDIAIASNSGPHQDGVVVIADDMDKTYASRYITSCFQIYHNHTLISLPDVDVNEGT